MKHLGNQLKGPGFKYLGHFAKPQHARRGHNDGPLDSVVKVDNKSDGVLQNSRDFVSSFGPMTPKESSPSQDTVIRQIPSVPVDIKRANSLGSFRKEDDLPDYKRLK